MGNTLPPPAPVPVKDNDDEEQHQQQQTFSMLSRDKRGITFDERIHLPRGGSTRRGSITLKPHPPPHVDGEFKLLARAATYDPRMRRNPKAVQDVLHRRYFNLKEERDESSRTLSLSAIPEVEHSTAEAIVVVDPFSTGMIVAQEVLKREYACIVLYSDTLVVMKPLIQYIKADIKAQFAAEIYHNGISKIRFLQSCFYCMDTCTYKVAFQAGVAQISGPTRHQTYIVAIASNYKRSFFIPAFGLSQAVSV
jgi:hypothetical protein